MSDVQFIGVDVAKDKFDVSFEDRHKVFSSDKTGLKQFVKWIREVTKNPWVCMESTSIYSRDIADFLYENDITSSIVNAMQIKNFCKAKLLRNKNDKVDAKAIESFAKTFSLRAYKPRSEESNELNELSKVLNILKKQLTQLKNQHGSIRGSIAKKALKQAITDAEKRIGMLEKKAVDIIKGSSDLLRSFKLITSIPGIGNVTAIEILGMIEDIGSFENAKQFAAFAGVTPQQRQSGTYQGKTRLSKVGSPKLRRVLYMASLSAMRFNTQIKPMVERMKLNLKHTRVIIGAVMRRLAHLIFGVLKNQSPFDENHLEKA